MTPTARKYLFRDEIASLIDEKLKLFVDGHSTEFKGLRDQMSALACEVRENKSTTDGKLATLDTRFQRFYNEDPQNLGYLQIARASDQRRNEDQDSKTNLVLTQLNMLVNEHDMRVARSAAIKDLIRWLKIAVSLMTVLGGAGGIFAFFQSAAAHR